MQAKLITGGVAAFGFLFLAIGADILLSQFRFARRAATTQGTSTAVRAVFTSRNPANTTSTGPSYRAAIRFTTAEGQHIEGESRVATSQPAGQWGRASR